MSVQRGKGHTVPADRRHEAFPVREWLANRLERPLAYSETTTFGRMAHDRYTADHKRQPYTMRFGRKSSQITVYLPEDEPMLDSVLADYRTTDTYRNAENNQ